MYYLLLFLLYPLALLPLRVLYVLSDICFVVIYYLLDYRKKLVLDNLRNAFPGKNIKELKKIRRQFYHSFCDQWIETLKLLAISDKELDKRMQGNWQVFDELYTEKRNAFMFFGHFFNWEWVNAVSQLHAQQVLAGVYLPPESKAVDRLMLRIRNRANGLMISMKNIKGPLQQLQNLHYVLGLIADQNPSNLANVAWLSFMNRDAPFFVGSAHMARRSHAAVLFAGSRKIKRGYYYFEIQRYCNDASEKSVDDILHDYVAYLEAQMHKQPENWMWTHNRWKHKRES